MRFVIVLLTHLDFRQIGIYRIITISAYIIIIIFISSSGNPFTMKKIANIVYAIFSM